MTDQKLRRLTSWKEIAEYLERDVRTAVRWEREKQLPIHHQNVGNRPVVFAYTNEIDSWWSQASSNGDVSHGVNAKTDYVPANQSTAKQATVTRLRRSTYFSFATSLVVLVAAGVYFSTRSNHHAGAAPDVLIFSFPGSELRFHKIIIPLS